MYALDNVDNSRRMLTLLQLLVFTSGAIQGSVPANDIFVVLPQKRDAPKSHIYKGNHEETGFTN